MNIHSLSPACQVGIATGARYGDPVSMAGLIFGAQVSTMLVIGILVARWFVAPRLRQVDARTALTPLLLVQATRVVGLVFIVDAVTDPLLPRPLAITAAAGDTLTAALALLTLALLRRNLPGWRIAAWATTVVGIADLATVAIWGITIGFPDYRLGAAWFIPTVLGPMMMVTHALMIGVLVRSRREQREAALLTG